MLKPNIRSMSITSQESYSAVMIADLVAEVPVSPETEQGSEKHVKEETNLGYDGHLDGESNNPTVDGADTANSHITNGGGITRGVILNAVQFGQPDLKSKSEEKAIQLSTTLPVPSLPQQISEPHGFKDMSFLRKVVFGFSFLPSVLFVLCFSVILPCNLPKPCIEELWVKTFNNTEPLSRLQVPQNVLFTALEDHKSVLIKLHKDSGDKQKTLRFDTDSAYLKCGNIIKADRTDCIVMDGEGKFYNFNDTHSNLLWNPISEDEHASEPVILPDCNGDTVEELALAVSNTKIKIMYNQNVASSYIISDCDSIPTKLMPWTVNGTAALIFVCKKDGEDKLVKIPQNVWCPYSETPENETLILYKGAMDSLNNANILPVENGLVLWFEDEISMLQPDGSIMWTFTNESHSEENRFIFYGNFKGENKKVALLSSSISSGFKATLLNSSNGYLMESINSTDFEATDAVTVRTEKKDFIIVLQKKTNKPTDILATALTQINDFSTTIVNLVSNEEIHSVTQQVKSQEISYFDREGNFVALKELADLQNADYKTTITAVYDEKKDVLNIYLLSTSENNETVKTTKVRSISIANWNQSKKSKCLGN